MKGAGELSCDGLACCIAVCALDPDSGVGGLAHVMLPAPVGAEEGARPAQFASTALVALLEQMEAMGAQRCHVRLALVGAAQVLQRAETSNPMMDLGWRNADACMAQAAALDLPIQAQDFGGSLSRSLRFDVATGDVIVRTSLGEKILCTLRGEETWR
jgi:chemotaxis protein CheD